MKKLISLALAAVLALGILSGCGKKADAAIQIAVPNDTTNEARALLLLEANGIIKLKDGAGITATKNDIAENPHNVEIVETEAAQIPNILKDVDYAVINSNYAINAGLNPVKDSLAIEGSASAYANILAVKEGNESSDKVKALVAALESQQVADYIAEKYDGAVVSTVENPGDGYDASVDYAALAGETISVADAPRRDPRGRQGDPCRKGHHPRHSDLQRLRCAQHRRGGRHRGRQLLPAHPLS